ncbi:hypothetical protein ACSBLW_17365 [Thioclava sp. FR2]
MWKWMLGVPGVNLAFAVICLGSVAGLPNDWVMGLSALFYLRLAFWP